MANVDGSIRIGVELEEQGYKRTLKALQKSVASTTKDIEKLFQEMSKEGSTLSFDEAVVEIKRLETSIAKITQQASLLGTRFKSLDSIKLTLGAENVYRSLAQARKWVEDFYSITQANNISINVDQAEFEAELQQAQDAYNDFINELSGQSVDINANNETIDIGNIAGDTGTSSSFNIADLSSKLGVVKTVLTSVVTIFKKLIGFSDHMVGKFKEAGAVATKLKNTIEKTVSGVLDLSRGILDFAHDASGALGITQEINETLNGLGFGDLVGADLLADAIRDLANVLKEFTVDSINSGKAFQAYYLRIKDTFGASRDVIYDYAKSATQSLGMSETAYMEASSKIGVFARSYLRDTEDLTAVTVGMTNAIADLSAQTGFSIEETMTKVLSGLRGNTEAIEELGINVKVADMQNWLNKKGIEATFKNLNSEMQNLYRTWYMLDTVANNGTMGYAMKMAGTFAGQLSTLKARFEDLKTIVGTYLMQALVPVLQLANILLSRLVDIANMVGRTFGLLDKYSLADSVKDVDTSGIVGVYDEAKEALSGAIDSQNELTDSANKTGSAIKKAGSEAKKALAPFHKLNILSNKEASSGTTTGIGGDLDDILDEAGTVGLNSIIDTAFDLDTEPVEKAVDEWLEALKKAIQDGEWYTVGVLLGEKLNSFIDKIDFTKHRDKLYNGAIALADVLNGVLATVDFTTIGTKLADGLNTVVNTINLFLDRVNFEDVGKGFASMLRGLMLTTEWDKVGKLWSQKTRILLDILHGFVTELSEVDLESGLTGWQELGYSLGNFVEGMLDLEWGRLGADVGTALTGIADAIKTFNGSVDFVGITTDIVTGFNNMFNSFDATKASEALSSTLNSIISILKTTVTTLDWFEIGSDIGELLFGTLANLDWASAGGTVTALANGVLNLLMSAVYEMSKNYNKIFNGVQTFADAITDWLNNPTNQSQIGSAVNNLANMLLGLITAVDWTEFYDGISGVLSEINWGDLITLLHVGDGITLSLKAIFGEEMLSGLLSSALEFGWNIIKEIGAGILSGIDAIIATVGTALMAVVMGIGMIGASIIDGLVEGITGRASYATEMVTLFFQGIIDWVREFLGIHSPSTVFAEIGTYLVEGFFQGISSVWGTITEYFSTVWGELKTSASEKVEAIKQTVVEVFTSMRESINEIINGVKTSVTDVFYSLVSAIKSPINAILGLIEAMANGVINGVNSAIGSLNGINITIPEFVPGIGGNNFSFEVPYLPNVSIPRLAQGAVIQPNHRFLAELGDQTRGVNIEAPLDTIKQGLREELMGMDLGGSGTPSFQIYIGNSEIDDYIVQSLENHRFRSNGS